MPSYKYRAANGSGKIQTGIMAAANENALAHALKVSGHELIYAREQPPHNAGLQLRSLLEKKPPQNQVIAMCVQIADLLNAGVPLLQALAQVNSIMPAGKLSDSLREITQDVTNGMSLTAAFAKHKALFDTVFLSVLKAGEKSGDLSITFTGLYGHLRWQARISTQLRRALRYPLFMFLVAGATTCFMMTMVVPQIVDFLNSTQTELPFLTRILVAFADMLSAAWFPALSVILSFAVAFPALKRHSRKFSLFSDRLLLSIPIIGDVIHQLSAARFTASLSLLLKSGMSLPESMETAAETLNNTAMILKADNALQKINNGEQFSKATSGLLSPFATQMLVIGEQSGNLQKALDEVTRFYDKNAKDAVDDMIGTLEPALTIVIGGLLAWVVLAVLGPVYGSIGNISRVP